MKKYNLNGNEKGKICISREEVLKTNALDCVNYLQKLKDSQSENLRRGDYDLALQEAKKAYKITQEILSEKSWLQKLPEETRSRISQNLENTLRAYRTQMNNIYTVKLHEKKQQLIDNAKKSKSGSVYRCLKDILEIYEQAERDFAGSLGNEDLSKYVDNAKLSIQTFENAMFKGITKPYCIKNDILLVGEELEDADAADEPFADYARKLVNKSIEGRKMEVLH